MRWGSHGAELAEIALDLTAAYELTTTLDCSAFGNDVTYPDQNDFFQGIFDGGGFTLTIDKDTGGPDHSGLFRRLSGATVTDLTIEGSVSGGWNVGALTGSATNAVIRDVVSNATVSGVAYVGGLVGTTDSSSTIEFSSATGTVTGIDYATGGLVGVNNGDLFDSWATGNVNGGSDVGGLVGYTSEDSVARSNFSTGDVTGTGDNVGGFVGFNGGEIYESFSTSNVNGDSDVGGFVGEEGGATYDSYARGDVTANSYAGGFVGYRDCGDNYRSYSTGTVTSGAPSGGFVGVDDCGVADDLFWDAQSSGVATSNIGMGKTTAEMKDIATFTDTATEGLINPWDFTGTQNDDSGNQDIWTIDGTTNDGYPFHNWFAAEEEDPVTTASTTDTPTGSEVIIEWTGECELDAFEVKAESANETQDVAFEYPNGLVNFTLGACTGSTTITITYVDVENAAFVLRKYLPSVGSYATLDAAELAATTIDGAPAVQATYELVDNGPLDADPTIGVLTDPVGIAEAVIGAPRTGGGGTY